MGKEYKREGWASVESGIQTPVDMGRVRSVFEPQNVADPFVGRTRGDIGVSLDHRCAPERSVTVGGPRIRGM